MVLEAKKKGCPSTLQNARVLIDVRNWSLTAVTPASHKNLYLVQEELTYAAEALTGRCLIPTQIKNKKKKKSIAPLLQFVNMYKI